MKLQFKQIQPFLQKPDPACPVILVYGPDEGLVRERGEGLAKLFVPDLKDAFMVADVSPEQIRQTPSLLTDEARSLSMLGGRRVVRLRAQGAENDTMRSVETAVADLLAVVTPDDNVVIIEAGDLGTSSKLRKLAEDSKVAAALPCYVEDQRDVGRIITDGLRAENYAIDRDALAYMAGNIVGDRGVVRGEIEKLITYMGPENRQVRMEDVQACIGDIADLSMDLLTQFTASGRYGEAERVLKSILGEGVNAVVVTRSLQNYFLRLHLTRARIDAGDAAEIAMKKLKPPVFWKNEAAFKAQLAAWRGPMLEQALLMIASAEYASKQTGSSDELILSGLIFRLARLAAGDGRRRA